MIEVIILINNLFFFGAMLIAAYSLNEKENKWGAFGALWMAATHLASAFLIYYLWGG